MSTVSNPDEIWKPVPVFDGRYEVSSEGRMRRVKGRGCTRQPRLLHPAPDTGGYYQTTIMIDGKKWRASLHQFVALAFLGPCPEGAEVNHIDRDKSNNRPGNLEYLTHLGNMRHGHTIGEWNTLRGEASPNAKLTEQQVAEIRASGLSQRQLAALYGVSQPTICYIKSGKQWKHVED